MSENTQELEYLKQRAMAAYRAGHYAGALELFKRVLLAEPLDSNVRSFVAMCEHQVGNSDQALEIAHEAAASSPELLWPNQVCGFILAALDRPAEAELYYGASLRIDPNSVYDMAELATCLLKQGQTQEAAKIANSALKLDPENARARYVVQEALHPRNIKTLRDFLGSLKLLWTGKDAPSWNEGGLLIKIRGIFLGTPRSRLLLDYLGPVLTLGLGYLGSAEPHNSAARIWCGVLTVACVVLFFLRTALALPYMWRSSVRSRSWAVLLTASALARTFLICATACVGWRLTLPAISCAAGFLVTLAISLYLTQAMRLLDSPKKS